MAGYYVVDEEEIYFHYCMFLSLDSNQILALAWDVATNLDAYDSKEGVMEVDDVLYEKNDQEGHRDLQHYCFRAYVETYIAIIVFGCMDLAWWTNGQERMAFCTFFVYVKSFRCQTCLQPLDLMSNNYLFQGYLRLYG